MWQPRQERPYRCQGQTTSPSASKKKKCKKNYTAALAVDYKRGRTHTHSSTRKHGKKNANETCNLAASIVHHPTESPDERDEYVLCVYDVRLTMTIDCICICLFLSHVRICVGFAGDIFRFLLHFSHLLFSFQQMCNLHRLSTYTFVTIQFANQTSIVRIDGPNIFRWLIECVFDMK